MDNISKCKHCGDFAFLCNDTIKHSPYNYDYSDELFYVKCHGCNIRTPYGTKEEVLNIWNRSVTTNVD